MPNRRVVASELGALLKVLSNPDRILIVHALAVSERCSVTTLAEKLGVPPTRVSQHLTLLKAYRIVGETKEGRNRFYSLSIARLPDWLRDGVDFVADRIGDVSKEQAEDAKRLWIEGPSIPKGG